MPKQKVTHWTPEEDAYLREHYNSGVTAAEIGRALGRTRSMVIGRASRIGLSTGRAARIGLSVSENATREPSKPRRFSFETEER